MKIGVFAQYINTRNDIRDLLFELNKKMNIVLFLNERDKALANLLDQTIEVRFFSTSKFKYRNYFSDKLYKLFGKLPESKENYYITENFKLHNAGLKGIYYFIDWSLLRLSRLTPKFISYKNHLSLLRSDQDHILADIDQFFCITQIYDDAFYAAIQKTKKPVINYVYSWDHACKMKCFLKNSQNHYLTWSEPIGEDLNILQGIKKSQIHILGATQLIYLFEYLRREHTGINEVRPYFYLTGGTGNGKLLNEEINRMEALISAAEIANPDIIFKIRPYPFVKTMSVYSRLSAFPNVEIEKLDEFKTNESLLPSDYEFKYNTIAGALALLHFGTTLSLEAAHINVPVILIDTAHEKKLKELDGFIHQYQNDKYLNQQNFPNVLKSTAQIANLIEGLLNDREQFLPYNNQLKQVAEIVSMDTILNKLIAVLNEDSV